MLRNVARRLDRLEAVIPASDQNQSDLERHRSWLKTLSDDDLGYLEEVSRHIDADGTYGDLSVPDVERLDAVLATWETFDLEGPTL